MSVNFQSLLKCKKGQEWTEEEEEKVEMEETEGKEEKVKEEKGEREGAEGERKVLLHLGSHSYQQVLFSGFCALDITFTYLI